MSVRVSKSRTKLRLNVKKRRWPKTRVFCPDFNMHFVEHVVNAQ